MVHLQAVKGILRKVFVTPTKTNKEVAVIPNSSILAAAGQKMASTPGVSATLFNALAKANINVRAIAQGCSEYNITVVVKKEDCVRALRAVHSRFYLSKTSIDVGIIGPGLIGAALLNQLREHAAVLKEKSNTDLRVMGILGSKKMLLSDTGVDLSTWKEVHKEKREKADLEKFVQHITTMTGCEKEFMSLPLDKYLNTRALQRQSFTHYIYEATVGASLPIMHTLRDLLQTGDKIIRIEGIFRKRVQTVLFSKEEDAEWYSRATNFISEPVIDYTAIYLFSNLGQCEKNSSDLVKKLNEKESDLYIFDLEKHPEESKKRISDLEEKASKNLSSQNPSS
ncbi:unnamed protein product [Lactuca virosa]|uniref:aspartate kinase n=1 Tax=Lactuca virosa TaxID=75947 RepID=A0AAU9NRY8_9ASTR|nr:unnamed protein product [Lactuca virosa]